LAAPDGAIRFLAAANREIQQPLQGMDSAFINSMPIRHGFVNAPHPQFIIPGFKSDGFVRYPIDLKPGGSSNASVEERRRSGDSIGWLGERSACGSGANSYSILFQHRRSGWQDGQRDAA
jgi:hypothetical protein